MMKEIRESDKVIDNSVTCRMESWLITGTIRRSRETTRMP